MDFQDNPYAHITPNEDDLPHLDETNTVSCPCDPDYWITVTEDGYEQMTVQHYDQEMRAERARKANLMMGAA